MVPFEKMLVVVLGLDAVAAIAVPIVYFFAIRRSRDQSTRGPTRVSDGSTRSGGELP